MKIVRNIAVGEPDVDIAAPSHVPGVHEGNWPGHGRARGRRARRASARATIEKSDVVRPDRSTGIDPEATWPIDPRMPKLTPP